MHVIQWQRQYPLDRKAGRCHERIRTNSSESGASSPRAVWYRSCSGQKNRYTHSLARRGGSQRRTICWNCIDFSLALGLYKTSDRPQNCLYWRSESHGSVTCHRGLTDKALAALSAGVKTVFLPQDNQKDVAELPSIAQKGLKIHLKTHIDEIIDILFKKSKTKKLSNQDNSVS